MTQPCRARLLHLNHTLRVAHLAAQTAAASAEGATVDVLERAERLLGDLVGAVRLELREGEERT